MNKTLKKEEKQLLNINNLQKEDRKLPEDGFCRYCGGYLWQLEKDLWKCGHCLRLYNLKGEIEINE